MLIGRTLQLQMALKTSQRHIHLAIKLTILVAVLFPLVSGNACSGDGSAMDTCPEGEYCDSGSCHNCSLCSVNALMQGMSLTKCLCEPTSYKICVSMPASGEQLIEHPEQLSFRNLTGFEGQDWAKLKESYNRSSIDCTVPTTTKEPTSLAVRTTTLTTTFIPETETPEQTSSSIQSTTKEAASPTFPSLVLIIVIAVLVVMVFALVGCILYLLRGKFCNSKGTDAGDGEENGDGEEMEQLPV